MRINRFGATELKVSELGFGCGAVGGLMVLGDQERQVMCINEFGGNCHGKVIDCIYSAQRNC